MGHLAVLFTMLSALFFIGTFKNESQEAAVGFILFAVAAVITHVYNSFAG